VQMWKDGIYFVDKIIIAEEKDGQEKNIVE
jgi:hypothetical protein